MYYILLCSLHVLCDVLVCGCAVSVITKDRFLPPATNTAFPRMAFPPKIEEEKLSDLKSFSV